MGGAPSFLPGNSDIIAQADIRIDARQSVLEQHKTAPLVIAMPVFSWGVKMQNDPMKWHGSCSAA